MNEELLYVVDDKDHESGKATFEEICQKGLITRASSILVFNGEGKLFVHQRSKKFRLFPGYFDVKVGGFVTFGEGYHEAALRELKEELGVSGVGLQFLFRSKTRIKDIKVNREVYRAYHNGPFTYDDNEVEDGKFLAFSEIERLMKEGRLSPSAEEVFLGYRGYKRNKGNEGFAEEQNAKKN